MIVYGLVGIEIKTKQTAPYWLVALGDASYSTYLSHVLVLSAIGRVFALVANHNVYFETAFVTIGIITVNIVGLLSYVLIERRTGKRGLDAKTEWRLVSSREKSPPLR